ncbi:MAG: hypothetical protein AAGF53_16225 [Pseudomonadota bacterium]
MYKFIQSLLAALMTSAIASCETKPATSSPPIVAPLSHAVAMGFTPWPADLTAAGVDRTYAYIHDHANLMAHHFDGGIPWDEALESAPFPKHLRDDWAVRKSRTPGHFQTFVAVTPLDFDRTGLALAWTDAGDNKALSSSWSQKPLNHPDVKRAYLNYVERVIAYFQPDYLAIGIEANIMVSKSPSDWSTYLDLNQHTYNAIKTTHPNLPVFTSVQYEHLRGIEDDSKRHADKQFAAVKALMKHSDLMALSTYKFGQLHPNPMRAGYFESAETFGKPIAIAESGAMSAPVKIFGTRLPADEAGQARFVSGVLDYAVQNQVPFVVNWVAVDFDPMIKKLPSPMGEIAKAWVHTGLQDADGDDKAAASVWNSYLAAHQTE